MSFPTSTINGYPWIREIAEERARELQEFFDAYYGKYWRSIISRKLGGSRRNLVTALVAVLRYEPLARRLGWRPISARSQERNWPERLSFFIHLVICSTVQNATLAEVVAEVLHSPLGLRLRDDVESPHSLGFSQEFTSMRNTCNQRSARLAEALDLRLNPPPAHAELVGGHRPRESRSVVGESFDSSLPRDYEI